MSFPFGNNFGSVVESNWVPEGTILLMALRSKGIPVRDGETITIEKLIDWEETARASAVIYNIGEGKK